MTMNSMVGPIRQYVMDRSEAYRKASDDHYDFWNEHIRFVYEEAVSLAQRYHADVTVVALGALLHDIALIEKAGERKDHHLNGKILSEKILERFSCPEDIRDRVLGCVLNHRSPKNATNPEEMCVCDADILAHFDNVPMLFNSAFNRNGVRLYEIRDWMRYTLEKEYQELSDGTRELFRDRYRLIMSVVMGDTRDTDKIQAGGGNDDTDQGRG